jgi:hypothetical protein
MRRLLVAAIALVVLATLAGPAAATRGGGGRVMATISFASPDVRVAGYVLAPGESVTFAVDPVGVKDRGLYMLWVANTCTQDGVTTYAEYKPVSYTSYRVGQSGPFTLSSVGWTDSAANCVAYVWEFPNTHTPLSGATLTYEVS